MAALRRLSGPAGREGTLIAGRAEEPCNHSLWSLPGGAKNPCRHGASAQSGQALAVIRIVGQTAKSVAPLIVDVHIEIRLSPGTELRRVVHRSVRIVNHAADAMAAIVAAVIRIVRCSVPAVVAVVVRHAANERVEDNAADNRPDIVTAMVVHARRRIERVAAAVMVAADIGKDAGTSLRDPYVSAARIETPGPVENARAAGDLVDQLWAGKGTGPAFVILVLAG